MWAAEQLSGIEPGHPDILAHCAAAAWYDKSYARIAHFVAASTGARYEAASGTVKRNILGPRSAIAALLACREPPPYWQGAAILGDDPLTLKTARLPWGYSAELAIPDRSALHRRPNGGQYWVRLDIEVIKGSIGVSMIAPNRELRQEQIFQKADGRKVALIPVPADLEPGILLMVRSGGKGSSLVRIRGAELMRDPDRNAGAVAPIDVNA